MKVTIDGITYEGTEDEIRRIVENPPCRPPVKINWWDEWGRSIPQPPRYTLSEPYNGEYPIVLCSSLFD